MAILRRTARWILVGAIMGAPSGLVAATLIILVRDVELLNAYLTGGILGALFGILGGGITAFALTVAGALLVRAGGSPTGTGLVIVFGTIVIGLLVFTL